MLRGPVGVGVARQQAAPPLAPRHPLSAYRDLGRQDGKHGPGEEYAALPEKTGPAYIGAYSEGYVDASGEIPPHLTPWKLFPVGGEHTESAYERARDTRQVRN